MKYLTTIYNEFGDVYGYQVRINYSGQGKRIKVSQYFSVRKLGDKKTAKNEAVKKLKFLFKEINKGLL